MDFNKKSAQRQDIRNQRKQLHPDEVLRASHIISEQLIAFPLFLLAQKIGFYSAQENEIDLSAVAHAAYRLKKSVYFPVISKQPIQLLFYETSITARHQKNIYDIDEPVISEGQLPVNTQDLNLIFVPLVAFDEQCHRMGRGAGYYDRLLAFTLSVPKERRPILIGVAYEFQKVENISAQAWDVPMDFVVTERQIYARGE